MAPVTPMTTNTPSPDSSEDVEAIVPAETFGPTDDEDLYQADDDSDDDDEGASTGSHDTNVVENPDVAGEFVYGTNRCLVALSTKSDGRTLLCERLCEDCNRRNHLQLRTTEGRRGKPGIYLGVPNRTGMVHDALADTYVDIADRQAQQEVDRIQALALATSRQKQQADRESRERTTVVGFDLVSPTPKPAPKPFPDPTSRPVQPVPDKAPSPVDLLSPPNIHVARRLLSSPGGVAAQPVS